MPAQNKFVEGVKIKSENVLTYAVSFVVLIALVVIIYKLYKAFSNVNKGVRIGQAVNAADATIAATSANTGISKDRVTLCAGIAREVAVALNVATDVGWWYATTSNDDEDRAIQALKRIQSPAEAVLVSEYFRQDATKGLSLKQTLTEELNTYVWSSSNPTLTIPFFEHFT